MRLRAPASSGDLRPLGVTHHVPVGSQSALRLRTIGRSPPRRFQTSCTAGPSRHCIPGTTCRCEIRRLAPSRVRASRALWAGTMLRCELRRLAPAPVRALCTASVPGADHAPPGFRDAFHLREVGFLAPLGEQASCATGQGALRPAPPGFMYHWEHFAPSQIRAQRVLMDFRRDVPLRTHALYAFVVGSGALRLLDSRPNLPWGLRRLAPSRLRTRRVLLVLFRTRARTPPGSQALFATEFARALRFRGFGRRAPLGFQALCAPTRLGALRFREVCRPNSSALRLRQSGRRTPLRFQALSASGTPGA